MGSVKPPRQVALVLSLFPREPWAQALVSAVNQFALEVVRAFTFGQPVYKTLDFTTGAAVADSFPIDFPVEATPVDVWVSAVPSGDNGTSAVTVKWQPISTPGLAVRVNLVTGLAVNTTYSIRLGYR